MILNASKQENIPTWEELIGNGVLIELDLQFEVNFSSEIFDVIMEGQQFEKYGYELNPAIRIAIMRKVFYIFSYIIGTHNFI